MRVAAPLRALTQNVLYIATDDISLLLLSCLAATPAVGWNRGGHARMRRQRWCCGGDGRRFVGWVWRDQM